MIATITISTGSTNCIVQTCIWLAMPWDTLSLLWILDIPANEINRLHWLLRRFGNEITAHNNATSNLAHNSAAAFVQAVLVPEMAVRLIMEDMKVTEKKAREVLEESRSIGETLNLKDYQEDIYGTGGNWVDVNNFKN